ncbi:hypothetical protein AQ862_06725 [Burkholderia pseudomallei]|nr:hypothetical protein AQ862_06725 [Burkholderia pseudomallei]
MPVQLLEQLALMFMQIVGMTGSTDLQRTAPQPIDRGLDLKQRNRGVSRRFFGLSGGSCLNGSRGT